MFHYFLSLCGHLFRQNQQARALLLSLVVEWPGFSTLTAVAWPQSLPGNPSPASSHCRPRPPEISLTQPKFVPGSHPFRIHLTQDTLLQGKWNEYYPTWLTVYGENLAVHGHTHTPPSSHTRHRYSMCSKKAAFTFGEITQKHGSQVRLWGIW